MNALYRLSLAAIAVLTSGALCAAPVVDHSPDALGLNNLSAFTAGNTAGGQNFLAHFTLTSSTTIGGASIYSNCAAINCGGPSIGTAVVTKIRNDVGGVPDAFNLFTISSLVTAIDSLGSSFEADVLRIHTDFSSITLLAGDYWIGISGAVDEIGWNLQPDTPSAGLWQLSGDSLTFSLGGNNIEAAFQIDGAANETPEPATTAMVAAALLLMGGLRRRRISAA